jgi:hypothetical protein
MSSYEHCSECDARTGRAGKHDDSFYHASEGPFCEECHESWAEKIIQERDQLRAELDRSRACLSRVDAENSALNAELAANRERGVAAIEGWTLMPSGSKSMRISYGGVGISFNDDEPDRRIVWLVDFLRALYAAPAPAVVMPDDDELMQMAFEIGEPCEDATGYWFSMEDWEKFTIELRARLNAVQELSFCEYCGGNDQHPQDHCMDCTRPAQPIVSGLVPDGYKLVPIKITELMRISAWNEPEHGHSDLVERIWAGALAASPSTKEGE